MRTGIVAELLCSGNDANDKITDIATSFGSFVVLATIVELGRNKAVVDYCFEVLDQSLRRALLIAPVGSFVHLGQNLFLQVVGNGRVAGFSGVLRSLHYGTGTALTKFWENSKANGRLHDPVEVPSHFLPEILYVLVHVIRSRREANKKPLAQKSVSQIADLRLNLFHWSASWADRYIIDHYCKEHDVDSPPPALKAGAHHKVHPGAIWDLMQDYRLHNQGFALGLHVLVGLGGCSCFDCSAIKESRQASLSLGQVIEVRKKDARRPSHRNPLRCLAWTSQGTDHSLPNGGARAFLEQMFVGAARRILTSVAHRALAICG